MAITVLRNLNINWEWLKMVSNVRRGLAAAGIGLISLSLTTETLKADDKEPSPVATIQHDCDGVADTATPPDPAKGTGWVTYWVAQKGAEPDITIFVTNSCECEMNMKLSSATPGTAPVVLPIRKGQTKAGTAPKASKLEIQCLRREKTKCAGTYQLW
jgi:hypothetical protein